MIKVLVVEDDVRLAEHISGLIQQEGMVLTLVSSLSDLETALSGRDKFQVIILDRLLGSFDTKSKILHIQQKWTEASILVLSAINTPIERAELLNMGADDYLGKPFLSLELLARIKSLSRRRKEAAPNYRQVGNTVIDLVKRVVSVEGKSEAFPAKEFLLLKILSDDLGRVLNRGEIFDAVWGGGLDVETNVVEATIANLRKHLVEMGSVLEIKNMRNAGYWIEI